MTRSSFWPRRRSSFPGKAISGTCSKRWPLKAPSTRCGKRWRQGNLIWEFASDFRRSTKAARRPRRYAGLGIMPGRVRRFEGIFKVPHIGWNQLVIRPGSTVFRGVAEGSFVYYCHSYYAPVTEETAARTEYGSPFAAAIEKGPIWAVQFHPEKSGEVGLQVLRNFLES